MTERETAVTRSSQQKSSLLSQAKVLSEDAGSSMSTPRRQTQNLTSIRCTVTIYHDYYDHISFTAAMLEMRRLNSPPIRFPL